MTEAIRMLIEGLQQFIESVVRLFEQLRQFIALNPIPFITTLFGILGSVLLGHWLRRREQAQAEERAGRTEHFDVLKRDVLNQMLAYLDEHMLPILRHQIGNVGLCRRQLPSPPATVAELPAFEEILCFKEASEAPITYYLDPLESSRVPEPPESQLMQDARRNHFARTFRMWDTILERFMQYNEICLRYVEDLRAEIMLESLLPEFDLQSKEQRWVNARALALVIFYRQLGLSTFDLAFKAEDGMRAWVYKHTFTLARGTVGEVVPLEAKMNRLVRRDYPRGLTEMARALEKDAIVLRKEVEEHRLTRRLPGKCPYL